MKPAQFHRYNFYLPPELVDEAKLTAKAKGWSTAELVRKALTAYLKALKKSAEAQNHGH